MMEFCHLCPRVEVSTHTALVPDLFAMLRQNDVDLLYFLDQKMYFPEWIKVSERPENIFFVASRPFSPGRAAADRPGTAAGTAAVSDGKGNQLPLCHGTTAGRKGV